ncbi:DeoR family transcriptional regulator [Enterococcus hirae]
MIEKYIEKDIIRTIKLIDYIYELKTLSINEAAERLMVTAQTIKRDYNKLVLQLEKFIES